MGKSFIRETRYNLCALFWDCVLERIKRTSARWKQGGWSSWKKWITNHWLIELSTHRPLTLDGLVGYYATKDNCACVHTHTPHTHAHTHHTHTHTDTHTHTHTHTRTHTHTHTHTPHTHTCWFLWFTGTFHRRNGFYTVQAVCAIALHLPYT